MTQTIPGSSLAAAGGLVDEDTRCHAGIQALHLAAHGNADQAVAALAYQAAQAVPFRADDQGHRATEVGAL